MRGRRVVVGIVVAAVGVLGLLPASASAAGADTTPPVLRSVSFSAMQAQPGQDVVITLDAADDSALVGVTVALYEATSGQTGYWRSRLGTTTFTAHVGTSWANGEWKVGRIELSDTTGNTARYVKDGRLVTTPPTTTTHGVDLVGPVFTVSQATDWSPPVLTSLAPAVAHPSGPRNAGFAWQVDLKGRVLSELGTVWASGEDPDQLFRSIVTAPPAAGSATVTLPRGGRWHLRQVELTWSGLRTIYRDSGELEPRQGAPALHHDLTFDGLDRAVAPGAPVVSVVPRATRVSTYVDTVPGRAEGVTGYRVAVQPANVVRVVPVSQAGADGRLAVDVTGLVNGVEQTVSVTATGPSGDSPAVIRRARPVLSRNVTGTLDVTGDRRPDLVAVRQPGVGQDPMVIAYPGTGTGGVRRGAAFIPADRSPRCDAIAAFRFAISSGSDLLCRTDELVAVHSDASGVVLGSRGWGSMRWVDGGFDLNGDGRSDVLAMNSVGDLVLYRQTTQNTLLAPVLVGRGWQSMISVVSAGDLNGDRRNDVVAVDASGRLWLYPGTGTGKLGARRQLATGWHTMGALLPLRDFNGDGKTDLGGITVDGRLLVYRGTGTGAVRAGVVIAQGWQVFL